MCLPHGKRRPFKKAFAFKAQITSQRPNNHKRRASLEILKLKYIWKVFFLSLWTKFVGKSDYDVAQNRTQNLMVWETSIWLGKTCWWSALVGRTQVCFVVGYMLCMDIFLIYYLRQHYWETQLFVGVGLSNKCSGGLTSNTFTTQACVWICNTTDEPKCVLVWVASKSDIMLHTRCCGRTWDWGVGTNMMETQTQRKHSYRKMLMRKNIDNMNVKY